MAKKQPPATPADSKGTTHSRYAAVCMVAVALALTSYLCLSVLTTAAGVDVTAGAGAIVAVLFAVSKVCSSLGRR